MLQVMDPSQQYVALGTIGRSKQGAATSCRSEPWDDRHPLQQGPWIPVPLSNDYLTSGTTTINSNSTLVKAVNCLTTHSSTGTHLASPMKSAARYMLGLDSNRYPAGSTARTGTIQKVIIFETDGAPNESIATGGSTNLDVLGDVSSKAPNTTDMACTNFKTVADNAKTAGILVVTVAFNVSSVKCSPSGSAKLVDTMAEAASPAVSGAGSAADFDCGSAGGRTAENADGDFFFCAAPGDAMAPIFKTAIGQLSSGIRLIRLP